MSLTLQSGAIAVTAPTWNPYLASGAIEVRRDPAASADYLQLVSGVITIGSNIVDAYQKDAGRSWAEAALVTIGGVDVTQRVVGVTPPSVTEDDKYSTMVLRMRGDVFNILDHALCDAGQTMTLSWLVRGAGNGTTYTRNVFTGNIRSAESEWDTAGEKATVLFCEDRGGPFSRINANFHYVLEEHPWGAVVGGVGGECEVAASSPPTTSTLEVAAGQVLLDRTGAGSYSTPGGNAGGIGWPYNTNQQFFQNHTGSKTGGIAIVDIPAQTLDLSTMSIDLTEPGLKSVFVGVDSAGGVSVLDGDAPANACLLATFELEYEGQLITPDMIVDQRRITVEQSKRNRAEMTKLICERYSIPTGTMVFPTTNNDELTSDVVADRKPLLQAIAEFLEPSRWVMRWDGDGNPRVYSDVMTRAPEGARWTYDQNKIASLRTRGIDRATALADVQVRGMQTKNNGLTPRVLKSEWEEREEATRATVGGSNILGGSYTTWGTARRMELVRKVRQWDHYLGDTLVLSRRQVWKPKNELDPGSTGRGPGTGDPAPGLIPNGAYTSCERGINLLHSSWTPMKLCEESAEAQVYQGRANVGVERLEKRLHNPVDYSNTSWGYRGVPGHGWLYPRDRMIVTDIVQHRKRLRQSVKVRSEHSEYWTMANPVVSGDGLGSHADGGPYGAAASMFARGYYNPQEELILSREEGRRYSRLSKKHRIMQEQTWARQWRQASSATTHGAGLTTQTGPGGMGNSEGSILSADNPGFRQYFGDFPTTELLQDDIERTPVGARAISAAMQATFGIEDNVHDEEHDHCETQVMCYRVALKRFGRSMGLEWTFTAAYNPALTLHDTVSMLMNTRGSRRYAVRGLVIAVSPDIAVETTSASTMSVTMLQDYNDVKATLATRT